MKIIFTISSICTNECKGSEQMDSKILALIAFALATLAFYRLYHTSCLNMDGEDDESGEAQWYRIGMIVSGSITVVIGAMVYQARNKSVDVLTEPFDSVTPSSVESGSF